MISQDTSKNHIELSSMYSCSFKVLVERVQVEVHLSCFIKSPIFQHDIVYRSECTSSTGTSRKWHLHSLRQRQSRAGPASNHEAWKERLNLIKSTDGGLTSGGREAQTNAISGSYRRLILASISHWICRLHFSNTRPFSL